MHKMNIFRGILFSMFPSIFMRRNNASHKPYLLYQVSLSHVEVGTLNDSTLQCLNIIKSFLRYVETREALCRLREVAFSFGHCVEPVEINSDINIIHNFVAMLREREEKRKIWHRQSPQIHFRKKLVDYLMEICSDQRLTSETTYLALYLLDHFMDTHEISKAQLSLVVAVCIVISGKMFEVDNRNMKFKAMARLLFTNCEQRTVWRMVHLEGLILKAFNFDILVPTEVNFLEAYLLYAVDGYKLMRDANNNNNNNIWTPNAYGNAQNQDPPIDAPPPVSDLAPAIRVPGAKTLTRIQETAFAILQEVTRYHPDSNFNPSLIAAAILMAARREHGINCWTVTLENITSYNLNQVLHCLRGYLQPRMAELNFKAPFDEPIEIRVTFVPALMVVEDSEQL